MHSVYKDLSTLCISLVAGGTNLAVTFLILVQFGYKMNDSIPNLVIFLTGFVFVLFLQKRIHRIPWIYKALGIVGKFVVSSGFILIALAYLLDNFHSPNGPLDGIQYFFLMIFGIIIIVSGLLLWASSGLGYLSRKQSD